MKFFDTLINTLEKQLKQGVILKKEDSGSQPTISVLPINLLAVCQILKNEENLYFDSLSCLTGVDMGNGNLGVIYHLYSMPHQQFVVIKSFQKTEDDAPPTFPSVSDIWKTALWHEREAFDLLGIVFQNHPNLKRILLPEDWQGYPLRKDYQAAEKYRNIPIAYNQARKDG